MEVFLTLVLLWITPFLVVITLSVIIIKILSLLKVNTSNKVKLAVVIFSIIIFASILIKIIEPSGYDGVRPPDAGVQATTVKSVLSVDNFISEEGNSPNDLEFINILSNIDNTKNCSDEDYECLFNTRGNNLNNSCDSSNWKGEGEYDCYYRYEAIENTKSYKIWAKSWDKNILYFYDSSLGKMQKCNINNIADCELL